MLAATGELLPLRTATTEVMAPLGAGMPFGAQPAVPDGQRAGLDSDVPWGGASYLQPGGDYPGGREAFMRSLGRTYEACPWFSTSVDTIARTVTAGGVRVVPAPDAGDDVDADAPPPEVVALRDLIKTVNPSMDMVQLCRGIATDIGIYGDAFVEIVWLLGRPVALWPLDPATMSIEADEHGNVTGYTQVVDARRVDFDPHQVIHIPADSPRGSLYGMGIGQKALIPITIWLYTAACIKETMRRGNPPHIHMDWPLEVKTADVRAWRQFYRSTNLGPANIGNPITTVGNAKLTELQVTKIADYLDILTNARDTVLSEAGVPPAKAGIIESGNLGGGTGNSQDKSFDKNTCGPVAAAIMEKLTYHLVRVGFGITDWIVEFTPVDWRSDTEVEEIRDKRLRSGAWTLNDYLIDIGKPPLDEGEGGDVHALVTSKEILTWEQVLAYAEAAVAERQSKANTLDAQAQAAADHAQAAKDAAANGHPVPPPGAPPGTVPGQPPPGAGVVPPDDQPDEPAKPDESRGGPGRAAVRLGEHYRRVLTGAR